MDAKFRPSFIPNQPLSPLSKGRGGSISLLYVIASIVFIITIGLVGVVIIAEQTLTQDIETLNQDLVQARESFELATIAELKKVSARTSIANNLLDNHLALSKFLEILGDATYTNVSFSGFSSQSTSDGSVSISLEGIAGSFNTLILQRDLFESLTFFEEPTFSGFDLDEEGKVSFSFEAFVDPSLVSYKRYVTGEEEEE